MRIASSFGSGIKNAAKEGIMQKQKHTIKRYLGDVYAGLVIITAALLISSLQLALPYLN